MKYLVAFGCSHTNGSMLDGKNGSSEYNVRNGFPAIIANEYNYNLINISKPGGSNQYIHRSIVEFLTHYYDPDNEYLFLINWSSRNRLELRYKEDTSDKHTTLGDYTDKKAVPFTAGTDPKLFSDPKIINLLNFTPYLLDDTLEADKWACWAYGVQQMLQYKNIPYLMSNTCEPMVVTDTNKEIIKQLDTSRYIGPTDQNSVMINYLFQRGYEKTPCWHYKIDGHQAWAKKLRNHLRELRYVE